MTTTTIYLTRHGQTEWNVQHRMQGHQDSALTPLGIQQAEWLAQGMQGTVLDAVYASPSLRAFRTAEIIRGERNIPLHAAEAFMELGLGEWEGRTSEENEVTHPDQYSYFWEDPIKFKIKDSETFEEVKLRALAKLQDIVAAHRGQSVLIVTHTVVIKVLMTHLEGRPLHKLWDLPYIHPTCLNRIDFKDGSHEIVLHGDISHYESDADEV
ncbi:histidine phosphatase family protein [Paenibacillus pinihumi]|uniref:histidine phosphatase family protein n=1 Tax=Paenibacillus pinihumi TaxID=669462 RepID=UPI0003F69216|nr:histidine phosphatase family protein [Paenibacillus pinihumi]